MLENFGLIFYALAFFCLGVLFTVVVILYIDAKDMEKEMDAYDSVFKVKDKEDKMEAKDKSESESEHNKLN